MAERKDVEHMHNADLADMVELGPLDDVELAIHPVGHKLPSRPGEQQRVSILPDKDGYVAIVLHEPRALNEAWKQSTTVWLARDMARRVAHSILMVLGER